MNFSENGFRSVYHKFCIFPVNDSVRELIKDFPDYSQADRILTYGYADMIYGLTLEILTTGKWNFSGVVYNEGLSTKRVHITIDLVEDLSFESVSDNDGSLALKFADKLHVLEIFSVNAQQEETRGFEFLDPFRHKYMIDNVLVHLLRKDFNDEQIWVRTDGYDGNYLVGTLLSEPGQNFGYHKGEKIAFFTSQSDDGQLILCSDMNPSLILTEKDLEDGSMLRNSVDEFNSNQNGDTLIKVLELMRDSYVWVPYSTQTESEDDHDAPAIIHDNTDYYFPVFSSLEEIKDVFDASKAQRKHMLECFKMARDAKNHISAIVLNVFSGAFILNRDYFDLVENMKSNL